MNDLKFYAECSRSIRDGALDEIFTFMSSSNFFPTFWHICVS